MNLLAIDTSTDLATVALSYGEKVLHKEQESQRTHAQHLLPMIDEMLQKACLPLSSLDAIVFGCGPGSFTGLRIACSIAKGLAYAHDLPLIPVSTLSAIAFAARQQTTMDKPILAMIDARMQEMYWAYFEPHAYKALEQVNSLATIVLPTTEPFVLAGYGLEPYREAFPAAMQVDSHHWLNIAPSAKTMIELAKTGNFPTISAAEAQPVYVRNQVTG